MTPVTGKARVGQIALSLTILADFSTIAEVAFNGPYPVAGDAVSRAVATTAKARGKTFLAVLACTVTRFASLSGSFAVNTILAAQASRAGCTQLERTRFTSGWLLGIFLLRRFYDWIVITTAAASGKCKQHNHCCQCDCQKE